MWLKQKGKHDEFDDRIVQGVLDVLLFEQPLLSCILLCTMWYINYLVLISQSETSFLV